MTAAAGYVVAVAMFNHLTATSADVYPNQWLFGNAGTYFLTAAQTTGFCIEALDPGDQKAGPIAIAAGQAYVFEAWHSAGTVNIRVNGGTPASVSCGNIANLTSAFGLGKMYSLSAGSDATVFMLATMSAKPAAADTLVANLKSRYGIA